MPSVILVGGRGFGAHHLENARGLEKQGRLRVVAIADPAIAREHDAVDGTPVTASLEAALALEAADVVIIATPIGTHAALCETALRAGADVLLEKPPVPTFADFDRLLAVQAETGGAVQVGFQSLGSHALRALHDEAAGIGAPVRVSAIGLWSRPLSYWARARWAGKRVLDGLPVVDGVATNPLAHAIATALHIGGLRTADDVVSVETELYRANAIASDDTTVVRVTGRTGEPITCALTICATPPQTEDRGAIVRIEGERGMAQLSYTTDVLTIGERSLAFGRDDLLTNLLDHRESGAALLVPLAETGAFMRVVEAVRTAAEPVKISPEFVTWHGDGDDAYPVVADVDRYVRRAAETGATFSELGAPWAFTGRDTVLHELSLDGCRVATLRDGGGTIPFSSPRPYLHPVSTRGGVIVSDHHPADHDWHLGLGFAVQDAAGVNFWGGRTYVDGSGYVDLHDRGRIVGDAPLGDARGFRQRLDWRGPRGDSILTEDLDVRARELGDASWVLDIDVELRPCGEADVVIESPGSKGRTDAGYGGLFWRLPPCRDARVFTPDAEGEPDVNGSASRWLAWSAEFLAQPGRTGDATVVLAGLDAETRRDPWFVRAREYPGIGSAVAWDAPTAVSASGGLRRRYRAIIADARLTPDEVDALLRAAEAA